MKLYPGERVITKSQLEKMNVDEIFKIRDDEKYLIKYKTRDSRLMYNLSLITLIINTLVLIGILTLVFGW